MQFGPYDLKRMQLSSYLGEFFVKPDMADHVWVVAKYCMEHPGRGAFAFKFSGELAMRQFGQACLLSCGRQFTWEVVRSYFLVQSNLGNERLLTDYGDLDVVFILHEPGTMRNSIMGEMLSQVAVLRGNRKTFLLDTGGPVLTSSCFRVVSTVDAFKSLNSLNGAADKATVSLEEFNI
jgi:hypothetical protein